MRTQQGLVAAVKAFFTVKEPDGENLEVEKEALKQRPDVLQMQTSLASYWKIVYKRFCDFIPMRINLCMCVPLQKELIPRLSALKDGEGSLDALMAEPPAVLRRRNELERSVKSLAEAQEILSRTGAAAGHMQAGSKRSRAP
eukprot:tig00020592_g11667.t1